jgi:hypothetical protein
MVLGGGEVRRGGDAWRLDASGWQKQEKNARSKREGGREGQRGGETGRRLFMSSRRETCRSSRYFPPCPGPAYDSRYAPTWYVSDTRDWVPGWPRPAATATRGVAAAKAKPNGNNASVVPPRHTGRTLSPVPSLSSACAT